ncbi:MAG: hypothetical protein MZV63_03750 [Marinilabiliales bacterium]|nr:hypothetical protein [Marinilabiliales bacterium]
MKKSYEEEFINGMEESMEEQEKDDDNHCISLFRCAYRNFDVVNAGGILQFDDACNVVRHYSGYIQIHDKDYWKNKVENNSFAVSDSLNP